MYTQTAYYVTRDDITLFVQLLLLLLLLLLLFLSLIPTTTSLDRYTYNIIKLRGFLCKKLDTSYNNKPPFDDRQYIFTFESSAKSR